MKILSSIAETTNRDRSGDSITREKLESIAAQVNKGYKPQMWQHNPIDPKVWRVFSAIVEKRADGLFALSCETAVFVEGDTPESTRGDGRRIPILDGIPPMFIQYGGEFIEGPGLDLRAELEKLGAINLEFVRRKGLDPISILLIGFGVFASKMAEGFLKEIGADAYKGLKKRLSEFLEARPHDRDLIYAFTFVVEREVGPVQVHYLLQNPTTAEVIDSIGRSFDHLVPALLGAMERQPEAKIIAFGRGITDPALLYAVREGGVPFGPDGELLVCNHVIKEGMAVSIGFR